MPRLTLPAPADYHLKRDFCSYGYFLLFPNHWNPRRELMSRVLLLSGGPVYIEVTQPKGRGTPISVRLGRALATAERQEAVTQLTRMLRLDDTSDNIRAFHTLDPRWKRIGRARLMRSPTLFEDVIKTVTSCNVSWPNTVNMNRRLCETLGEAVDGPIGKAFAFPSAAKIARTRPQTLRARCRVGYRDARIIELARLFASTPKRGGIDQPWLENPATPDDDVFEFLIDLPGIGPYAAANIMQLLGRYRRLPLDTESVRHGRSLLGYKGASAHVMKLVHRHYAPFGDHAFRSYWFELWDFYESKHGKSWTWERDSTGKMFTAALLAKT